MDINNPKVIKEGFYQYLKDADFKRLGPWLRHVIDQWRSVDIPIEDIQKAYQLVIKDRRYEQDYEKAIDYALDLLKLNSAKSNEQVRIEILELLDLYLAPHKEQMVKKDWQKIAKIVEQQLEYVKLVNSKDTHLGNMMNYLARTEKELDQAEEAGESPVETFLETFQTQYYESVTDDERFDYAVQIILSSKP